MPRYPRMIVFFLFTLLLFVSCTSIKPERIVPKNAPRSVKNAVKKAPKDALIGIGTAKMEDISIQRTAAEISARAEIARQINNVTTADVSGVVIVWEEMDKKGVYWIVVMLE